MNNVEIGSYKDWAAAGWSDHLSVIIDLDGSDPPVQLTALLALTEATGKSHWWPACSNPCPFSELERDGELVHSFSS